MVKAHSYTHLFFLLISSAVPTSYPLFLYCHVLHCYVLSCIVMYCHVLSCVCVCCVCVCAIGGVCDLKARK